MASFSPTEAAFEGFRLTREHPAAVLGWILAYGVFLFALALLAINWGVGQDLDTLGALVQTTNPNPNDIAAALDKLEPYALVAAPAQALFFAVLNCAIYRAVLRPYERGLGYFRLGMDELRMALLTIVLGLIWFAALFVVALVASFSAATVGLSNGPAVLAGAAVGLGVLITAVWVLVRLSLAPAMTFAERRLVVFGSWSFTKGRFWLLAGAYVLAFAFGFIVLLLLQVIYGLADFAAGGASGTGAASASGIADTMASYLTLPSLVGQAFKAVMIIAYYIIAASPSAIAYQGLARNPAHNP